VTVAATVVAGVVALRGGRAVARGQ
jgi:hypothetical protein